MGKVKLKISDEVEEDLSVAGAIDPNKYHTLLSGPTPADTFTLSDPDENYENDGLYKHIRNESGVAHDITGGYRTGTSANMPNNSQVYLLWRYDDDESFDGDWIMIRQRRGVVIT